MESFRIWKTNRIVKWYLLLDSKLTECNSNEVLRNETLTEQIKALLFIIDTKNINARSYYMIIY